MEPITTAEKNKLNEERRREKNKGFQLSHHGEWCHFPARLVPDWLLLQTYLSLHSLSAMTRTHWKNKRKMHWGVRHYLLNVCFEIARMLDMLLHGNVTNHLVCQTLRYYHTVMAFLGFLSINVIRSERSIILFPSQIHSFLRVTMLHT